jgi:hypothetical protein
MKYLTMTYDAKGWQVIKYLKELQKREKAYQVVESTVAASNPGLLRIATATLPVPGLVPLQ